MLINHVLFIRRSTTDKQKNINIPAFINDIKNSGLTNEVSKTATVAGKVDKFNRFMNNILDIHAPFKTKNIVCRPNKRWLNREISEAKKTQRECNQTKILRHSLRSLRVISQKRSAK